MDAMGMIKMAASKSLGLLAFSRYSAFQLRSKLGLMSCSAASEANEF